LKVEQPRPTYSIWRELDGRADGEERVGGCQGIGVAKPCQFIDAHAFESGVPRAG
jgi:hypothetical protein